MRYYKSKDGTVIIGISTVNSEGNGNISEKEYYYILELLKKMPNGMLLSETEKGYEYVKAPEDPSKGGLDPDQARKIIESSNISKENKALLKDYIYKEG